MLDGFICSLFRSRFVPKSLLLVSFAIQPIWANYEFDRFLTNPPVIDGNPSHPFDHQWVISYLETVNENTSLDEIVGFLTSLRDSLIGQGYTVPPLTKILMDIRDDLIQKGVQVEDEKIKTLYEKLAEKESTMMAAMNLKAPKFIMAGIGPPFIITEGLRFNKKEKSSSSKETSHTRRSKENVDSKTAIGLVKMLAGALLCIIPHPATITAGGSLVLNGIMDCVDAAREKGDENEKKQKEGPLANPPADYHKQLLDTPNAATQGANTALNPPPAR